MTNSTSFPSRITVRRLLIAAISLFIIFWLAINCYGAWYIARNTANYGLPTDGAQSEVFATDPQVATAERSALAILRPMDVRIGDAQLHAWYAPGRDKQPGWVLVHGAGDNRTSNIRLALALHEKGYPVLSLELSYVRGDFFSGGKREAREIDQALQWLEERTAGQRPFLYGCSTGAFNVLVAAARETPAAGVVADSGFVSFSRMAARSSGLPEAFFIPMSLVYPLFSAGGELVDLQRKVGQSGLPIHAVIIHGTGDSKVDPGNGPELARITGGELWAPDGVGHCAAFDQRHSELLERLDEFVAGQGEVERALPNPNRL